MQQALPPWAPDALSSAAHPACPCHLTLDVHWVTSDCLPLAAYENAAGALWDTRGGGGGAVACSPPGALRAAFSAAGAQSHEREILIETKSGKQIVITSELLSEDGKCNPWHVFFQSEVNRNRKNSTHEITQQAGEQRGGNRRSSATTSTLNSTSSQPPHLNFNASNADSARPVHRRQSDPAGVGGAIEMHGAPAAEIWPLYRAASHHRGFTAAPPARDVTAAGGESRLARARLRSRVHHEDCMSCWSRQAEAWRTLCVAACRPFAGGTQLEQISNSGNSDAAVSGGSLWKLCRISWKP